MSQDGRRRLGERKMFRSLALQMTVRRSPQLWLRRRSVAEGLRAGLRDQSGRRCRLTTANAQQETQTMPRPTASHGTTPVVMKMRLACDKNELA